MSEPTMEGGAVAVPAAASAAPTYKHPALWVPTSYIAEGLIWVTVTTLCTVIFKQMGMGNDQAALWSSILGAPYFLKPLWAPLLELYRTKKFFVVMMQFVLGGSLTAAALALKLPGLAWAVPVIILLAVSGFAGATQDIATDGVYVTTLDTTRQARFAGIQSMCWSIAPLVATGPLVVFSGYLHDSMGNWGWAWMTILLIIAGLTFLIGVWHTAVLPAGAKADDAPKSASDAMATFGKAFATFFQKKDILKLIAFAFFYRFGVGLLDKLAPLFMIDSRANGGLGLTNQVLGIINGTAGSAAFILGSVLGGLFVARFSLKKSLLFLCLAINIPNATFLYLASATPESNALIVAVVMIEKFGYGFGAVGHMIYMMQQIAPGPYKTAHYSFATAFMGLCMSATGAISGLIQKHVGYQWYFIIVLICATPSLLATILAPFHHPDATRQGKKAPAVGH